MRLFVAVRLDDAVVAAAVATARNLQRTLGSQLAARWVSGANMHLTVRFIGHVSDEGVAAVLDALRPPLTIAPFDLELGGTGVFPRGGPPRVVWIGVTAGLASLRSMHDELNSRLAPLGYEAERRAFSAHLTLARVKDVPRGAVRSIREAVAAVPPLSVRCRVDSATLFQSHLSPNGPSYKALFEILCAG